MNVEGNSYWLLLLELELLELTDEELVSSSAVELLDDEDVTDAAVLDDSLEFVDSLLDDSLASVELLDDELLDDEELCDDELEELELLLDSLLPVIPTLNAFQSPRCAR